MTGRIPPAAAMVAMIAVVAFTPVLFGGRTFAVPAHAGETLVWHARVADAVSGAHLPEWDPGAGLGVPLAGDPQRAALYPPAWLTAALPMPWGVDALLVAHLALMGAGVAAWARRRGADPVASAVAGGAAMLSVSATTLAIEGGALYAAAWLPWVGWAADRMASAIRRDTRRAIAAATAALAATGGALALCGPTGPALAAPAIAAAAVSAVAPRRPAAWIALALAMTGAAVLGAFGLLPALLGDDAHVRGAGALARFGPSDAALLAVAVVAAVAPERAGLTPTRRLALGAGLLLAAGAALGGLPGADGFWLAGILAAAVIAAVGLSRAHAAILGGPGDADADDTPPPRWRAAAAALVVAAVAGIPAARAWRGLPLEPRAAIADRPALLEPVAPGRIAWSDTRERPYLDAPPNTGSRFGFTYLPGRARERDHELTALWRRSSGAAERLLDLFGVELVLVPRSVAVPAALEVLGTTSSGDWVLAENRQRRARAFVAPRWSWYPDDEALVRALFPAAPGERGAMALSEVRLIGAGPEPPPRTGPSPSPPCAIESERPEEVALDCTAPAGGYAVLLDRFGPGWSADVDGDAVAIQRADVLVRAVPIPPGRHRVVFRYRAPGLRLGAVISLAGWLGAIAMMFAWRRQGRSAVPIEPG